VAATIFDGPFFAENPYWAQPYWGAGVVAPPTAPVPQPSAAGKGSRIGVYFDKVRKNPIVLPPVAKKADAIRAKKPAKPRRIYEPRTPSQAPTRGIGPEDIRFARSVADAQLELGRIKKTHRNREAMTLLAMTLDLAGPAAREVGLAGGEAEQRKMRQNRDAMAVIAMTLGVPVEAVQGAAIVRRSPVGKG
jgi:hypothetical protein